MHADSETHFTDQSAVPLPLPSSSITHQTPSNEQYGHELRKTTSASASLSSDEKVSSAAKQHAIAEAQLVKEVEHDEAEISGRKTWRSTNWSHWRKIVLPAIACLVFAWWVCGLMFTRHRWIVQTIFSWWIIGLIFFCFVDSNRFGKPIGQFWVTAVETPFFKVHWIGRYVFGWLVLLGLVFGSAYGFPLPSGTTYGQRTISIFGLLVFQAIYYASSRNRKLIKWPTVIVGLVIQQAIAMFVLKSGAGFSIFHWIATAASDFLHQGGLAGTFFFEAADISWFFVGVLGAVIFFVAFVQMMFYLGAMAWVVKKFAWLFFKALGISGAEAVIAAASPFIGQGESACLVKPYVDFMTPSELHLAMTSGFSTISGSVLTGYIALGVPATTLITASVMSIPASISISKMVYPEDDVPLTLGRVEVDRGEEDTVQEANALHAFSNGAWFGLKVAGLIMCNVLVVLALLYVVDGLLTWIGKAFTIHALTLELIFQYIFYPLSWLMGVPNQDLLMVGRLLGLKLFGNEFVAYLALTTYVKANPAGTVGAMTERGFIIATYSLCGFANLGSLGIQIGVLSGLAPSRAKIISVIAPSALIFGFLSTCQTATIAGMLV